MIMFMGLLAQACEHKLDTKSGEVLTKKFPASLYLKARDWAHMKI